MAAYIIANVVISDAAGFEDMARLQAFYQSPQ